MTMTVFLYPVMRKASKELAMGMILFRGALEGIFYFFSALIFLTLLALGNKYIATGADSAVLQSISNVLYQFENIKAPVSSIIFLIGATCYIPHFLPHSVDPSLVVRLGLYRRGYLSDCRPVEILSHGYRLWVLFGNGDVPAGISNGGLADRQRIQSICDRCPVCQSRLIERK